MGVYTAWGHVFSEGGIAEGSWTINIPQSRVVASANLSSFSQSSQGGVIYATAYVMGWINNNNQIVYDDAPVLVATTASVVFGMTVDIGDATGAFLVFTL